MILKFKFKTSLAITAFIFAKILFGKHEDFF